jgi:endonuclease III related protein
MMNFQINRISKFYQKLLFEYGPQGWWPLLNESGKMIYHKNQFPLIMSENQQLEICLGAILTQNTNWKNATVALQNLSANKLLSLKALNHLSQKQLADLIKPAGFFNQKAAYIKNYLELLDDFGFKKLSKLTMKDLRQKLLSIKGIGPETADCMLLYAFQKMSFVVDAYTTRILIKMKQISNKSSYLQIQNIFLESLESNINVYQEYHGLLVTHGKKYYQKKPYGVDDPLLQF